MLMVNQLIGFGQFNAPASADLITNHTSATSASGTASASTENGTRVAWQAFDGATALIGSNAWQATTTNGWLRYSFVAVRQVTSYTLRPIAGDDAANVNRAPKTWTFEGSNDGSTWSVLDTQTNVAAWGATETRSYSILSPQAFSSYRLNVSDSQGGSLTITEMRLLGY